MNKHKNKNKALRFFSFLLVFGAFTAIFSNWVRQNMTYHGETIASENVEECSVCGENTEEKILNEEAEYQVYYLDQSETVELAGGNVLGFSVDCSKLDAVNNLDSIKKLCSQTSGAIEHAKFSSIIGSEGGGVKVGKDTSFELVSVTYPLAFWLGQYVFENSNREAKISSPEYSSNGQQIDINYQAKTLSPAESAAFKKAVSGTVREDFSVKATLSVSGADSVNANPEGEYVVSNTENEPKCNCPESVSTSDYNVGMPNYIASNSENGGYFRQQAPGGDNYEVEEDKSCLQEGKDYDTLSMSQGVVLACLDFPGVITALFDGFFSKVFGSEQWEKCNGKEDCYFDTTLNREVCRTVQEDDCIQTENIGVKMTPIFGDPYECTDELCANAFLTYAYKGSLSPAQSASKKIASSNNNDSLMFFVGTPCQAKVDINGKSDLVPVTCLWDASPTLLDYKLQAKDKAPNQENFPSTFERYWNSVKVAISKSAEYYEL